MINTTNANQTKRCKTCFEMKPLTNFCLCKSGDINGERRASCNSCQAKRVMDYYKQHPEKKRLTDKKYAAGHRAIKRASHKKWADKNKEKAKLSNKTWFQKVKERQRLRLRAWRKENPELVKAAALRQRTRAKLNPANRIASTMSRTVGRCLRGMKSRRRWETLVGYSLEELRIHLEKKFTNKMNWANYGSYWHIDHIVPLSVFNFERMEDIDFKRCWALSNLQPLEKIENIKKGNRLTQAFQPALLMEDRYAEEARSERATPREV